MLIAELVANEQGKKNGFEWWLTRRSGGSMTRAPDFALRKGSACGGRQRIPQTAMAGGVAMWKLSARDVRTICSTKKVTNNFAQSGIVRSGWFLLDL